jgi:hypothetical protein
MRACRVRKRAVPPRKSALILAALLTATPVLAAEKCLEIESASSKYGDTAHCYLQIDGKVIIDGTCRYGISGDGREYVMYGAAEARTPSPRDVRYAVAIAAMNPELPDRPFYGYYCRVKKCAGGPEDKGSKFINYGRVEVVDFRHGRVVPVDSTMCNGNKRFLMCFSPPYLICDPEAIKAWPKEEDNPPKGR